MFKFWILYCDINYKFVYWIVFIIIFRFMWFVRYKLEYIENKIIRERYEVLKFMMKIFFSGLYFLVLLV